MKEKPKVAILENSTHVTGALKAICNTATDLSNDFDFVFITPATVDAQTTIRKAGFQNIFLISFRELNRKLLTVFTYFPLLIINTLKVRRILSRSRISLVHSNDLYNMVPPMLKLFGSRVPYICHIRFLPDKFPPVLFNAWLSLHLRLASRIVVVSDFLKGKLPEHEKIIRIYDKADDREKYSPISESGNTGIHTLLYLSNIVKGKGQENALAAFAKISPKYPTWHLKFTGGDMGLEKNRLFKEELKILASDLGIAAKVEWKDFSNDVEVDYKQAAIALNFSESESFSMTCLDALYFGCPMIATRSGGPAEIIDDGISGLLVPIGNIDAMTNAMEQLMGDPQRRSSMGIEGRSRVRKKFNAGTTSAILNAEYHRALGF